MHPTSDCLLPTPQEQVARCQGDLRMGLPCLIERGETRTIVVAVESLSDQRFDALQKLFGRPQVVLTAKRALAVLAPLALPNMSDDPVAILPPDAAPLTWFQRLADPGFATKSGPIGPLHLLRDTDIALHDVVIRLVKAAELLPAVVIFDVPQDQVVPPHLHLVPIAAEAALMALSEPQMFTPIVAAGLPLEAHDQSKLHVFRDPGGTKEHYAIEIGHVDRSEPVLSRLHSACFTGDVLGSLKCDCGPQLRAALARMGAEGSGVLLYLNQEGRGIGLANKMRVYDLQSDGFDTVEANHHLGYEDDERDFRIAAMMLKTLEIDAVRLLTNNPAKTRSFQECGITITEQLPLQVGRNVHNQNYLSVKALKSGHSL